MARPHRGRRVRATWVVAGLTIAMLALGGCTFGDDPTQAQPGFGNWFDGNNCVPVECLRECCNGWHYVERPLFHGGSYLDTECGKYQARPEYLDYERLMQEKWNFCVQDFADFDGGLCTIIYPLTSSERSTLMERASTRG
jgi:hypothetical protein